LETPALHEAAPQRGSVPQNSTACGRLPREPTREAGSTSSRRTGSSDDAEHELEPSTSPAASGVRAPDSLERRDSSRTCRYGYLVTTSPQSSTPPSTAASPKGVSPPASGVADFRGVTGGVYKARQRIHRGVADPRLLATPPSWRRVAASNPNRDRLFGIRSTSRFCSPLYRPM